MTTRNGRESARVDMRARAWTQDAAVVHMSSIC